MKVKKYIPFLLGASLLLGGCKDETWTIDEPTVEEQYGTLSFANINIEVVGIATTITSRASLDVNSFIVDIQNVTTGNTAVSSAYSDLSPIIPLRVGSYKVVVTNGPESTGFDNPYYKGESEVFTISNNEITEVQTIECKLSNIAVSVKFTNELLPHLGEDVTVNVEVNNGDELTYRKNEEIAKGTLGYFRLSGGTSLVATFTGTMDGEKVEFQKQFTDLKAGQHRLITYDVKEAGVQPDNATGTATSRGVVLDASVIVEDLTFTLDGEGEEKVNPDDIIRPGDDDTTDQKPSEPSTPSDPGSDNPGSDTPAVEPITFTPVGFELGKVNDSSKTTTAQLKIHSEKGIKEVHVKIQVPNQDMLGDVGLPSEFDLVNAGSLASTISGLGFPVEDEVKDKNDITFDISDFMELIPALGDGIKNFIITVYDNDGSSMQCTLQFE